MKNLEFKKGCYIKPYKNKQLEVIREGEKIIISDGHTQKGDIVQLEEDLAKKILNTIFGSEVVAIEINEEELKEIILNLKEKPLNNHTYNIPVLEEKELTDNTDTEEQNDEEKELTDNTDIEEQRNDEEVTDNNNTEESKTNTRRGRKSN